MPHSESPTSTPRRLRIFLCHASEDKADVRALYQRLQTDGFEPWLDEEHLLPGQDWQQEISEAVRATDAVVVCLSAQSVTKAGYVQKEIKLTLDVLDEQPEGAIFLIPARLEACEVPKRLSHLHWVNLYEERGYERLRSSLHSRAKSLNIYTPTPPPAAPPPALPASCRNTTLITVVVLALLTLLAAGGILASYMWPERETRSDTTVADALTATSRAESVAEMSATSVAPMDTAAPTATSVTSTDTAVATAILTDTPQPLPQESNAVTVSIGTNGQIMEMVEVPAGPFLMGSRDEDERALDNEKPQHEVTLDTYWIGKTEVTNAQFRPFVEGDGYSNPDYWTDAGWEWREENEIAQPRSWDDADWNSDEQPVVSVSWYECRVL